MEVIQSSKHIQRTSDSVSFAIMSTKSLQLFSPDVQGSDFRPYLKKKCRGRWTRWSKRKGELNWPSPVVHKRWAVQTIGIQLKGFGIGSI